uniref:Uncharacterized protein n=1 Tax=Alexandrium andersonii TaxID=327968 RepID=A0A7S2G046_9DINO|mmetsp:Transcript_38631/g.87844  ORF Transcript_38631/g.87844 Transcript_38631/m.87844 type:complete len:142 (+) Transcript_38631:3-428(+)
MMERRLRIRFIFHARHLSSLRSRWQGRQGPGGVAVGAAGYGYRPFTNWWQRYVDGCNPDRPHGVVVAGFLRDQGINPYLIQRDELEDLRAKYLMEFRYFTDKNKDEKQRTEDALAGLREKQAVSISRWKSLHPSTEETAKE